MRIVPKHFWRLLRVTEAYSKSCKTSKTKHFVKIINNYRRKTFHLKCLIGFCKVEFKNITYLSCYMRAVNKGIVEICSSYSSILQPAFLQTVRKVSWNLFHWIYRSSHSWLLFKIEFFKFRKIHRKIHMCRSLF